MAAGRVWLVLPDPLSARIFFDCGIVGRLQERLGGRLQVVFLMPRDDVAGWSDRLAGAQITFREELFPLRVGIVASIWRRLDRRLDGVIGFYPLALRVSLRHVLLSCRSRSWRGCRCSGRRTSAAPRAIRP